MIQNQLRRTHYCGEIGLETLNQEVIVMGWVNSVRDHGGVIFLDLRDIRGIVQCTISLDANQEIYQVASQIKSEYVIAIQGKVTEREESSVNPLLSSGKVEIMITKLSIQNLSKRLPFTPDEYQSVNEELRLTYRYLDLRRPALQKIFIHRSKIIKSIRDFLTNNGFLEIETPMLTKSTPEGARDFLVPSRNHERMFYALPQSPQLFKQIFMVAGLDRYFQITKCFRDEDLRADRQPEFTQLDLELSFTHEEEILTLMEKMFQTIAKEVYQLEFKTPFQRIPYQEAIERFGSDKPDIRFDLTLHSVNEIVEKSEFSVFLKAIESGGKVSGIKVPQGASFSRKQIEEYTDYVKTFGAKGLAYFKVNASNELESNLSKFFSPEILSSLKETFNAKENDLIFFVADTKKVVTQALGNLRIKIAEDLGLIPQDEFRFVWITDFPLFQENDKDNSLDSVHHPFTAPTDETLDKLSQNPLEMISRAYDIVLNGVEVGGGSIRIHQASLQRKIFQTLGLRDEEIEDKFGFFLQSLEMGAPPHGGIALGLDRLVMLLEHCQSLRETIAFPKTQKGTCLLTGSPSYVSEQQLKELKLRQGGETKK